jgi:hypothetical protein
MGANQVLRCPNRKEAGALRLEAGDIGNLRRERTKPFRNTPEAGDLVPSPTFSAHLD